MVRLFRYDDYFDCACFCIRSMEGRTKLNDSTGNQFHCVVYFEVWRFAKPSSPFISICSALKYAASGVNVWKNGLLPFTNSGVSPSNVQQCWKNEHWCSDADTTRINKTSAVARMAMNISSFKDIHICLIVDIHIVLKLCCIVLILYCHPFWNFVPLY